MNTLLLETRLLLRSRLALLSLIFLLLLSAIAGWSGLQAVKGQAESLQKISAAHEQDVARVASKYQNGGDAGYAAYYTNHLTWDDAQPLASLAFGQRDLQPYSLRVRLLGLHSQLYESESINPELALSGRFDFAFVLIYLVPLVVIALMHDLVTSERESGRLRLLASLPVLPASIWRKRLVLRYLAVIVVSCLPLLAVAFTAGAGLLETGGALAAAAVYIAFWFALSLLVAMRAASSGSAAAILLACFIVLTLVLPTLANSAITRAIPVAKGMELMLVQRQEVHQGWDLPKEVTFEKFFKTHPEWSDTPPVTGRFHWKWYYAMHQAGDEAVGPQVDEYRNNLMKREEWTRLVGYFLPAVGTQVVLHRLANTDLEGQVAYMDRIAEFHKALRLYYYPYVFNEQPFGPAEFENLPKFEPLTEPGKLLVSLLLVLALLSAALYWVGIKKSKTAAMNQV